jgi:diguanylate cyclase (GGDEF)-like protein
MIQPDLNRTLLIVDDDPLLLDNLALFFEPHNQVLTARSGRDALALLDSHSVGVILSDHLMPEMSGIELFQQVLEQKHEGQRIMMTGQAQKTDVIVALNTCKLFYFVVKPFDFHTLGHIVSQAFEAYGLKQQNLLYQKKLEQLNQTLEQKVRERTLELEEKLHQIALLNHQLEELATHDPGTALYNRRFFFEHFPRDIARANRSGAHTALMMVDLDHFKTVNDRFGHLTGDKVLWRVAQILQQRCRNTDLLARFGGEEFLISLSVMEISNAVQMAKRLQREIGQFQFQFPGMPSFSVTATIGLVLVPPEVAATLETDVLIETADLALYEGKRNGRNQVVIFQIQANGEKLRLDADTLAH